METSHRKNDFSRRGVSGIAAVLIVAGLFAASVGFLSLKFKPDDSSQGFFKRTSAMISKTFGDMFSSERDMPVVEIDLGESSTGVSGAEIKNTSAAVGASSVIQSSGEEKLTEKVSENKNPDSSAENSVLPSMAAGGNNLSAASS